MILFVKTSLMGGVFKKTKRILTGFLWKTSFMVCFVETKKESLISCLCGNFIIIYSWKTSVTLGYLRKNAVCSLVVENASYNLFMKTSPALCVACGKCHMSFVGGKRQL